MIPFGIALRMTVIIIHRLVVYASYRWAYFRGSVVNITSDLLEPLINETCSRKASVLGRVSQLAFLGMTHRLHSLVHFVITEGLGFRIIIKGKVDLTIPVAFVMLNTFISKSGCPTNDVVYSEIFCPIWPTAVDMYRITSSILANVLWS